jgi:transposase
MARTPYPTDLTPRQWAFIEPMIPPERPGGRHRTVDMREIVNAVLYLLRNGCSWRSIPHDLPKWQSVRHYYDRFVADGTWQRIHDTLREQVRHKAGRRTTPSAAIVDSQTVKTPEKGGPEVTTRPRRPSAASGTSPSTRWG